MIGYWYANSRQSLALASRRYRISNRLHEHPSKKVFAVTGRRIKPSLFPRHANCTVIRPFISRPIRLTLNKLRYRAVTLIADFDDLLFTGNIVEHPLVASGRKKPKTQQREQDIYRAGLEHFDAFTVSTAPLQEKLQLLVTPKPVTLVPNRPGPRWIQQGNLLYSRWKPGDRKIIRYFSGSPSHDADFELIRPILQEFMAKHRDIFLEVVGHIKINPVDFPENRFHKRALMPYDYLPELLASSWLNLAPLTDCEYNQCRSSIKFMEAAAFACPTISTPIADLQRHSACHPITADNDDQWWKALHDFLDDEYRVTTGQNHSDHMARYLGLGALNDFSSPRTAKSDRLPGQYFS